MISSQRREFRIVHKKYPFTSVQDLFNCWNLIRANFLGNTEKIFNLEKNPSFGREPGILFTYDSFISLECSSTSTAIRNLSCIPGSP